MKKLFFMLQTNYERKKTKRHLYYTDSYKIFDIKLSGNPTWQNIISLVPKALLLFVKKDVSKAEII
jgi:hypothetical protein